MIEQTPRALASVSPTSAPSISRDAVCGVTPQRSRRSMTVELMTALKPPSRNKQRRRGLQEAAKPAPGSMPDEMLEVVRDKVPIVDGMISQQHLKVFTERPREALCKVGEPRGAPVNKAGKWEVMSAIVDSGATITAVPPKVGRGYKVQESEATRRGVEYATAGAGSDTLPNLGEKFMAVLTKEGTVRGFGAQCADVAEPLESVRQLLGNKHCVLFGLGPNESEHLIINKVTGEVTAMRDDGINYLHDMIIIPPDEVEQVQRAVTSSSPFGGQA